MPAQENRGPAEKRALLAKVREAKRIAEAAYWQVLDLRIVLQEVETAELASETPDGSEPRSGLLGIHQHYSAAEDYEPDGQNSDGGDPSW